MESTLDASGVDQSSLEVSTLTGTSGGDERGGISAITLIAIIFCSLAFIMAVVLTLLFSSDLELYGDDDDSGGQDDDDVKIPTHYPAGSRRPPEAVTEAPTMTTAPPAPITTRRITIRPPPPPATPSPIVSTRPPTVTTRKPTPAPVKTTSIRTTKQPPPPPPPPSPPPTPAPVATTTTKRTTTPAPPPPPPSKSPRPSQSSIKAQSLLCTFGNKTNYGTKFPADGLCDYIFYDSMYKNNKNSLVANWGYDVYSILSKAQKTSKTKTQFGLGFAFEHRRKLVQDLEKSTLEVFWDHNVFNFGILDCPAHGIKQADMDDVFVALQALDDSVQKARATGNTSYIVLGAVSHTDEWNDYFKAKFSGVFTPDLFISVSHQFRGDPERSSCSATPPTILRKPEALSDAHDLYDAARALGSIDLLAGGPRLSISVSMKGRWSTLLATSKARIFAACEKGTPGPFFGSYTEICNTPPFSSNIVFELQYYSTRSFDPGTRHMLVYEDEEALRQKLCFAKLNYTTVAFGVAVYDLDYDDGENECLNQNFMGAYTRLQTVSAVKKFMASKFTSPSKLPDCSKSSG